MKLIASKVILCIVFIQIAFADICDFEPPIGHYTDRFGDNFYDNSGDAIVCGWSPYDNISMENPTDTVTMSTWPNGRKKYVIIVNLLKESCFKKENILFDSAGNILFYNSYIEKHGYKLQIEDNITKNIIYTDTPCDFTLIDPSSKDSMAFHFNGMENDNVLECKKIAKNLPEQICFFIQNRAVECRKYKKYMEYIEGHLKCWENLSECLNDKEGKM